MFKIHSTEKCQIEISKQIPKNEPVYLIEKRNGHVELFEPSGNSIELSSPDKLILLCPGRRNTLIHSDVNTNELSCANNFRTKLHQLNCTRQVTADLQTTSTACRLNSRHGLIYRAGFTVNEKFVKLYEMCYDAQSASAIYSHHQINGKAIKCKAIYSFHVSISIFHARCVNW